MHAVIHLPYRLTEVIVHGLHVRGDRLELLQHGGIDAGGGILVVNFFALGDGAGELREELGYRGGGGGCGGGMRDFEAWVDAGHD